MADFAIDDVDTINLLAAVVDNRVFPDTGSGHLRYFMYLDDGPAGVTTAEVDVDLIAWLIVERYLLTGPDHNLTVLDLGRSELDNALFMLEILTAIHEGRVHPTDEQDSAGRRLFAYQPTDDDQFDGSGFAIQPLVEETDEVALDRDLIPHLTDAGRGRLELFGILDTE